MSKKESLIEFPCDFLIKVIGKNSELFVTEIVEIAHKHFPNLKDEAIRHQPSKNGNYLSISIVVHAENQAALDALYVDLNQHSDIQMVL